MAGPTPSTLIPCTQRDLQTHEPRAGMLLPMPMRAPMDVRMVAIAPVTLSGTQVIGTLTTAPADIVLVTGQVDKRQNGPYVVPASGAWARAPGADALQHRRLYRMYDGPEAGQMWVVREPEPVVVGKSWVEIEYYGTTRFDEWLQQAEQDTWDDLNRAQQPILPGMLSNNGNLTKAKAYRALSLLYRLAAENSQDGRPDRNERQADHYLDQYTNELRTRTLELVDAARRPGLTIKVQRG